MKLKVLLLALMLGTISSCTYDTISPEEVEVPENVSFSVDVIPIFNESCNNTGCHADNGIPPNLTEDNAFVSLTFFGYVDVEFPEESVIYKEITTGSMNEYATDKDRAYILEWIKQGALDN